MLKEDFNQITEGSFLSKNKFRFENDRVCFLYRWYVEVFQYQPGWNANVWNTKYTISIIVDNESRHEMHKSENADSDLTNMYVYSFQILLRETKNKKYDEKYFSKLLNNLENIKIETKIKKNNYSKINAILNGNHFMV